MKTLYLIGILVLLGLALHLNFYKSEPDMNAWQAWKLKYNREYSNEIESFRQQVYYHNQKYIRDMNAAQDDVILAENQFMDLTQEEFIDTFLGEKGVEPSNEPVQDTLNLGDVDWRDKGAVSPIKDQGQCGSCWSFGCTGGLESANFLFGSKSMTLYSEQQLVDCSRSYGNQGCNGGLATQAYQYVQEHGLVTESEYPYKAVDQKCKIDQGPFKIKSFTRVAANNCDALKTAITQQPTSVSVDASNWSFYSGGIFKNCGTSTNHAVLAVGFSSEYWIVKNSWGSSWGEKGFIRLAPGNTCTICLRPSYPNL